MIHSLVVDCARYLVVVPIVVSAVFWLTRLNKKQRLQYLVLFALSGILTVVLAKLATSVYFDARPFVRDGVVPYFKSATDNGFPSDHTLLCALLAAVMWPFSRKLSAALYGVAVLVGASRVVSGVHHGVDIVGGLLIASAAVVVVWQVMNLPQVKTWLKMLYTKVDGKA